jgi:hypothetical protein
MPGKVKMAKIVKRLEPEDFLNEFHNFHLKEAVSARINIIIYERIIREKGDDFIVAQKQEVIGADREGKPILGVTKVKAKEALRAENERLESNKGVLQAIRELDKKF